MRKMKNAKKKTSAAEEEISEDERPALRSAAFARALKAAEMRMVGAGGLRSLFAEASKEAAGLPKRQFKGNWPYLQTMLRLIRAHERGEYKEVPEDALLWIVAALNYLIDPYDLMPDIVPVLGFVDDATVIDFVTEKTRKTLDDFMIWETTRA